MTGEYLDGRDVPVVENAVKGSLLEDDRDLEDNFLFVFRRREIEKHGLQTFRLRIGRRVETVQSAPPKNKKENGGGRVRIYKQATPSGVTRQSFRSSDFSRTWPVLVMPSAKENESNFIALDLTTSARIA